MHFYSSGGKAPKIADTHVVAHFDPSTGRIAHVHSITVFEGAPAVSEEQALASARSAAKKCGISLEGLQAKHSKQIIHARTPHRIDLASGNFVALDRPSRAKFARVGA